MESVLPRIAELIASICTKEAKRIKWDQQQWHCFLADPACYLIGYDANQNIYCSMHELMPLEVLCCKALVETVVGVVAAMLAGQTVCGSVCLPV